MKRLQYLDHGQRDLNDISVNVNNKSIARSQPEAKLKDPTAFASAPVTYSSNSVLDHLPGRIFDALKPHLRRSYVSKEQFLFQQDDALDYVYFPETAVISEFHILNDGRMVEVSITGKEGVIGIATLYHATRIANCVQVTQGGNVLRIESYLLRKISERYPEMAQLLHSTLGIYLRQITQKAACNMYHSVEERFCTWLLMVRDRCEKEMLKLTHEQIARTLGVYRPSVTAIALKLRERQLIDYSRGGISISNREGMENSACGCYSELGTQSKPLYAAHSA